VADLSLSIPAGQLRELQRAIAHAAVDRLLRGDDESEQRKMGLMTGKGFEGENEVARDSRTTSHGFSPTDHSGLDDEDYNAASRAHQQLPGV